VELKFERDWEKTLMETGLWEFKMLLFFIQPDIKGKRGFGRLCGFTLDIANAIVGIG